MTSLRCPKCRNRMIQKSQDGRVRIRTKIVSFFEDNAEMVCQKCGSGIPVDLVMGDPLKKSIEAVATKRLVLKKS